MGCSERLTLIGQRGIGEGIEPSGVCVTLELTIPLCGIEERKFRVFEWKPPR